jgi:predicted dehydrogenase
MGTFHARTIVNNLEGEAELVQIVDPDIQKAERLASELKITDNVEISEVIDDIDGDKVDGAIIASPSHTHADIARRLLGNGVNVLIEKPIALNMEDARAVDNIAKQMGLTAIVGHIELFNPVVRTMDELVNGENIRTMRFKRLGAVADQTRLAHDVVQDLMLHDISIAQMMADQRGSSLAKVLLSHGRSDTLADPDPAEAIVNFGDSFDVHFRASRAYSGGKVRSIEAETEKGLYVANLLTKSIVKKGASEGVIVPDGTYTEEIRTSSYFAQDSRQPLTLEQLYFLQCIRNENTPEQQRVSIDDAIRIMKITDMILRIMVKTT